jgi:hypothetical protein
VYRVRYEREEQVSTYLIAKTVRIENPDNKTSLTVVYNDVEVNGPLSDDAFILQGGEAGAP